MTTIPKRALLILAATSLLCGCLPPRAVQPFYAEKDLVFDEALVGSWTARKLVWSFGRKGENAYELVVSKSDGSKAAFEARLFRLKGKLYLDMTPAASSLEEFVSELFLPLHVLLRVDRIGPDLLLCLGDDEGIRRELEDHPKALKHELTSAGLVLTATTEELQKFIVRHDAIIHEKPVSLARVEPAAPGPESRAPRAKPGE